MTQRGCFGGPFSMAQFKDKLLWFLGILITVQLGSISYGVVECVNYAKEHPDKTRPTCLEIDKTLQDAVDQYLALILALMVPTKRDDP